MDSGTELSPNITDDPSSSELIYHLYKRRWHGVLMLILMNLMSGWAWITFASISDLSAEFFNVSENAINLFSVFYMVGLCTSCPAIIWMVHHYNFRTTFLIGAAGLLIGCWLRYAGAMITPPSYALTMVGQIVIGIAGSIPMALPSHYTNLWFDEAGKVGANAPMSLASPAGAAVAQIAAPAIVMTTKDIPKLVLYISIASSIIAIGSMFVPSKPPTPPTEFCERERLNFRTAVLALAHDPKFWLFFIPFSILVGFFNAISSLLFQILSPHGISSDAAGLLGATLIGSGLVAAILLSPIIGYFRVTLRAIQLAVPLIGICYLVFIWVPSQPIGAAYAVLATLGAISFTLLPLTLEWLAEDTRPISPEVSSSTCWMGGQLMGVLFVLIMQALKNTNDPSLPKGDMTRALVFQGVVSMVCTPLPLLYRFFGNGAR